MFVVGAESEWLWTGIQGGSRTVTAFGGGLTQTVDLASKVDWLSLNSVRVGFVAADRWLVYGKGGIALAHETHDFDRLAGAPRRRQRSVRTSAEVRCTPAIWRASVSSTPSSGTGPPSSSTTIINFRPQNVMTSGVQTFNIPPLTVGSIANIQRVGDIREEMHLVKFGINYHFTSLVDVITREVLSSRRTTRRDARARLAGRAICACARAINSVMMEIVCRELEPGRRMHSCCASCSRSRSSLAAHRRWRVLVRHHSGDGPGERARQPHTPNAANGKDDVLRRRLHLLPRDAGTGRQDAGSAAGSA